MNFALFHQVIVAGGLDPELRHSSTATRDTEKGSAGGVMVTVCGKTERKIKDLIFEKNLLTLCYSCFSLEASSNNECLVMENSRYVNTLKLDYLGA